MDSVREFVEPIKKKWVYHFLVSPKTCLIEKPEWYLNQTLKWIHEHIDVVVTKVDVDPSESQLAEVRRLFILCMLELVRMRLNKDMKIIIDRVEDEQHYEAILIHIYNEVVVFIKIIRQLIGKDKYLKLEESYDIMAEFSHQKLFEIIIEVEWDYSEKNLKEMTSSDARWDPVLDGDYLDHYKIPRCVDRFLLQIRSISERVECFKEVDCQFQLIDLQCSLFSKLLQFMKQSTESAPLNKNLISNFLFLSEESTIDLSKILRVLNAVNFLRLVLKEKCFIPHNLTGQLDEVLLKKLDNVTRDYKQFFNKLIDKVVSVYEYADCDLPDFYNFIQPKLANDVYETIRDETAKFHETRQTQYLLKKVSSKR